MNICLNFLTVSQTIVTFTKLIALKQFTRLLLPLCADYNDERTGNTQEIIMKRRLFRPALLIGSLLIAGAGLHIAHANVFESAVSAYENEEYAEAIESFREAAEDGNADAQFNLGLMYLKGEGVDEDYAQALEWFTKSAEQGNVRAETNLARMYAQGKGVAPDYGTAVSWFRKAADQGYPDAQYSLGVLYVTGNAVPLNYKQAQDLFQKAADQGNASAQYQLGLMYFKGKGMKPDLVEGYKWMVLAGEYDDAAVYREYAEKQLSEEQIEKAKALAEEWQTAFDENTTES